MKHWGNNGIKEICSEECPEGFTEGRLRTKYTEAEIDNLNIIDRVLKMHTPMEIITYYIEHNQQETVEHLSAKNVKVLTRILKQVGYNFSVPKPSKFKGKAATRNHESYINGGKKSSLTQRQWGKDISDADRLEWSQKQQEAHSTKSFKEKIRKINIDYGNGLSDEEKQRISDTKSVTMKRLYEDEAKKCQILTQRRKACLEKYGVENYMQTEEYKQLIADTLPTIQEKINITKRINQTFNSSRVEETFYNGLCEIFGESDIIRQYRDERYPFNCDFYIKSLDMFIELNIFGTHGGKPFIGDESDKRQLDKGKQRAVMSKHYQNALHTGTIRDVNKRTIAQINSLNYIVLYTDDDVNNFLATWGKGNEGPPTEIL